MKLDPDHYPDGYEAIKRGQTITFDCKQWSTAGNGSWIQITLKLVGKRYDPDDVIVPIARPAPHKK